MLQNLQKCRGSTLDPQRNNKSLSNPNSSSHTSHTVVYPQNRTKEQETQQEKMEIKQEHYGSDLLTALKDIQTMLKIEAEHWFKSNNSKTAEKIGSYDVAIDLLIQFIHENDIKSFCVVFEKFNITIDGIRSCFFLIGTQCKNQKKSSTSII